MHSQQTACCSINKRSDEIVSVWFGDDEDKKVVDDSGLTGENGSLKTVLAFLICMFRRTDSPYSDKNVIRIRFA